MYRLRLNMISQRVNCMYVCPVPCWALEPSGEGAWVSGDVPCRRLLQLQLQLYSFTSASFAIV